MNKHGVGLGLSICKNLIEQMAGLVEVQSREGFGSKFIINLSTSCLLDDDSSENIKKIILLSDNSSQEVQK